MSVIDGTIGVELLLNGKFFTDRRWSHIPRVGETILLLLPDGVQTAYTVTHVTWGPERAECWQEVRIDIVERDL